MQNKIKELRAKHNLTQQQLAEKVGVRRETIVFLEMGKYNPSLKLAFSLKKNLEYNPSSIISQIWNMESSFASLDQKY